MLQSTNGYNQPSANAQSNDVPVADAIQKLDDTLNKVLSLNFASGNQTLTTPQLMNAVFLMSGATSARELAMPALRFKRLFVNASSYGITVKTGATAGVVVPANTSKELWSDGTQVKEIEVTASSDATSIDGQGTGEYALTDGGTIAIDWNNGLAQWVVLGGNRTLTFGNPVNGKTYVLRLKQDGTGSRTVVWPTILWQGGTAPLLTGAINKSDIITLFYSNGQYYGNITQNY